MTLLDQIFSKERTLSTSLAEKAVSVCRKCHGDFYGGNDTHICNYIYICTYIHILYIRTDTHIMYTKALPDRILSSVQRSTILRVKPSLQVRIFYLFKVSSKMLIPRIYIYEIVDISSL